MSTINREAAIAYSISGMTREIDGDKWIRVSEVRESIKTMPSAQPEIVRCKHCKHRDAETGICEGRGWPMQLVPDDGFCDKGKRRRDESNRPS